jgi:DNA-binding NarL/FixJ family response regulator
MLEAGAAGYVLKQSPSDELIRAVRSVAGGGQYLDRALTRAEGAAANAGIRSPADPRDAVSLLSDAEERVLRLVAGSHSTHQIAQQLSMTTEEAGTIKSDAMRKAGLATRVQVVEYVRARGRNIR